MTIPMNHRTPPALGPPRTIARLIVAVAFATLVAACDLSSPTEPGTLSSITVTPNTTVAINALQQFNALGQDASGHAVSISPTWSIVAGGGSIDNAGLFTAGTVPGTFTATVKAASGGVSGTVSVTVAVGSVPTMGGAPFPATLRVNGTQQ
jgi:hypothetical protein